MGNIENVPLLDLTRFDDAFAAEIEEAFRGVFRSGRYIMGPEVDAFQSECAEYCQVKHALGVSSGSDALILALMGIDLRAGDEVICPTFTFFATAGAVWRLGAKPVFVDLDPDTYNWNTDEALAKMNDRTRALIPVHLFGQCAEMDSVLAVANERGVPVIEDAAQAIGSESKGRRAGGIGTIGCFSFFPSKNLGAFGDAGLVTTNDDELAKRLEILRVHGGFPKYYHQFVGGNFRIDALQAALLRIKLRKLDEATEARTRNAGLYRELFLASGLADESAEGSGAFGLPIVSQNRHIFNQFTLRIRDGKRDALREHLGSKNIGTEIYYPVPLHLQECFADLGHQRGEFPHAERAADETIAIPIFPELSEDEIRYVAKQIIAFFGK